MHLNTVRPNRREALWQIGGGFGGMALASLLAQDGLLADDPPASRKEPSSRPAA